MESRNIKHFESLAELTCLDDSALMQVLKDTHDNICKAYDAWELSASLDNSFIASSPVLIRGLFKKELDLSLKDFELIYQAICERKK